MRTMRANELQWFKVLQMHDEAGAARSAVVGFQWVVGPDETPPHARRFDTSFRSRLAIM